MAKYMKKYTLYFFLVFMCNFINAQSVKTFDCGLFSFEYPTSFKSIPIQSAPHMVLKLESANYIFSASYWDKGLAPDVSICDDEIYYHYKQNPFDDGTLVGITKESIQTKGGARRCIKLKTNMHRQAQGTDVYLKMVSYKPKKRPSIDNILNDPWMMEINKMNEEELDNLHKNIMEEFIELEVKKNSDNEVIVVNKNTAYTDKDTDAGSRGESPEQYFDESLKLKKIKKGEKFANHYLKINELLPAKFMNVLVEKIRKKYEDCKIEVSEKKFAFVAKFDIEQDFEEMEEFEEKNNICNLKIKLYEDEEGGYFINFIKKQGLIEDYYEFFTEIKAIIKKLLE